MELSNRESFYLTPIQQAAIYGAYLLGKPTKSYQQIADLFPELHINKTTVCRIIQRYEAKGNFNPASRAGRPSLVTETDLDILKNVLRMPNSTIIKAQEEIEKSENKKLSDM